MIPIILNIGSSKFEIFRFAVNPDLRLASYRAIFLPVYIKFGSVIFNWKLKATEFQKKEKDVDVESCKELSHRNNNYVCLSCRAYFSKKLISTF